MFAVIFEVQPKSEQWEAYLGLAKMLRPELVQVAGFVDNIRYRSLTRPGWLLSLSIWRDEKAVVRWRTTLRHHEAQEQGRAEILLDYQLRVGEITRDSRLPPGETLKEQRLDETETGAGTTFTLLDSSRSPDWIKNTAAQQIAQQLGLSSTAAGLVAWDAYEAVLTPGDVILSVLWRDRPAAATFSDTLLLPRDTRLRSVRVVRDYGMHDRREAPQYYPAVDKRS